MSKEIKSLIENSQEVEKLIEDLGLEFDGISF